LLSAAHSRGQGWPALCWRRKVDCIQATPWPRRARRETWWAGRSIARLTVRR